MISTDFIKEIFIRLLKKELVLILKSPIYFLLKHLSRKCWIEVKAFLLAPYTEIKAIHTFRKYKFGPKQMIHLVSRMPSLP